jgi:hypothetical protein
VRVVTYSQLMLFAFILIAITINILVISAPIA